MLLKDASTDTVIDRSHKKGERQMTTSIPITPAHQRIITETIRFMIARTVEHLQITGYPSPQQATQEQLQYCVLAKALRIVARYAEGYDLGAGDIRPNIEQIYRMLFPAPYPATTGYQIPADFHKTPLGEMIHAALARHYPVSQRITAGDTGRLLHVSRQTVHTWADNGTLNPIYDKGVLTFYQGDVKHLQEKREAPIK
jgi:hypothetical protein